MIATGSVKVLAVIVANPPLLTVHAPLDKLPAPPGITEPGGSGVGIGHQVYAVATRNVG